MFQAAFHRGGAVIVAAVAAALVWSVGFKGFMPLDQSIVWDGAWRLMQGQAAFVDFAMPAGFVPAALQAGAFANFGLSWTVYVAHAALANALFAALVFACSARVFGRTGPAFFYGLLAGIAFYPPMGTPYPDHHALLFGLVPFLVLLGDAARGRVTVLAWAAMPLLWLLAVLSKPLPGLFLAAGAAPIAAVVAVRLGASGRAVAALAIGGAVAASDALLLASAYAVSFDDLWRSLVVLPGATGAARLAPPFVVPRLGDLAKPGIVVTALALVYCWRALLRPAATLDWAAHAAATALLAAGAAYVLLSDNSPWFGLGALPLAAGLAHFLIERRLQGFPGLRRRLGWTVGGFAAVQLGVLHLDITVTRAANELRHGRWTAAEDASAIDPRLAGLRWVLPPAVARDLKAEDSAAAYRDLLALLRAREGNFVLIGDATILYSLAARPSAFPALWFHRGLAWSPGPAFDAQVAAAMQRFAVRRLVVDGEGTWTGTRAGDFAAVARCLARATESVQIGRFRVAEVPADCALR